MAKPTTAPPPGQQWVQKTGTTDEYTLKEIPGGVQLSPDALKPEMSEPELPEGVFQNKSSGAYTDKYGNVGQLVDGKFIKDKPVDSTAPMSTEEQAKGLIDYEYGQSAELGQELFGKDNPMKGTFAEVIEDFRAKQADQKEYFTTAQQQQEQLDLSATLKAKKAAQSSAESVTASLSQGREGVTSSTRPKMIQQYQGAIMEEIDNTITRFEMAQNARAQALKEFEEAQESGRADLVEQRRAQLVGAEQELKQTQTELLNAQSRAADLALKINEQDFTQKITSLENFQGMVDAGVEFDIDGLITMSNQLGLPVESLNAYYKGMETIRKDKSLSQEEKEAEIGLLNQQLQRELNGVVTAQAQNIEYYKSLVQSGTFESKDEQYAFARALGIEEYDDPYVQADLQYKQAVAKLAALEADAFGKPPAPGTMEYLEYEKALIEKQIAQKELQDLQGGAGGYQFVPGNVTSADLGDAGSNNMLTYTDSWAGSGSNNKGPDFTAPVGTPITSHISGTVVGVISDQKWGQGGWGNQIKVQDANGNIHQFSHLHPGSISWQVGDTVNPGDLIAEVGSTGKVTDGNNNPYSASQAEAGRGAHLDYTVYDANGNPLGLEESIKFAFGESIPVAKSGAYSAGQKALMSSLDPENLSGTDLDILKENDLTSEDLYSYIATNKKDIPQEKKEQIQTILDSIDGLMDADGKSAAVGAGFQKYTPGWLKPGEGDFIPGTDAAAFAAKFNSFRDNLALPALDSLKGAMSDKDIQFLRNSATALSLDMSEEEFDAELKRLKDKYEEILKQGTDISEDGTTLEEGYANTINLDDIIMDQYLNNLNLN